MMDRDVQLEVEDLYEECLDSAERDASPPATYEFYASMGSSPHERSILVAQGLEQRLVNDGFHARVIVEENSDTLTVSIHYLEYYVTDTTDGRWFVDQPQGVCWYFETSDEASAERLAAVFNTPRNAQRLQALRPNVGVEEASLRQWLLHLRDEGIGVTTFAYKGTGIFDRDNLLS